MQVGLKFLTLEVSASCLCLKGLTRTARPWRELMRLPPHKQDGSHSLSLTATVWA